MELVKQNTFLPCPKKAAIAAGADSLMIEVHPNPAKALSDGSQSLTPEAYRKLMQEVSAVTNAVSRVPQQPCLMT